jgi:hypothetical protein
MKLLRWRSIQDLKLNESNNRNDCRNNAYDHEKLLHLTRFQSDVV